MKMVSFNEKCVLKTNKIEGKFKEKNQKQHLKGITEWIAKVL